MGKTLPPAFLPKLQKLKTSPLNRWGGKGREVQLEDSMLKPLPFLLYINDFTNAPENWIIYHIVDDTDLIYGMEIKILLKYLLS